MDLSEETARQRLSRGRKLLHERVIAFVEGTLRQTAPGPVFTMGVVATLPAMTFSAEATTLSTVAKGGAAVKGAGLIGSFGAFLAPLFAFFVMWIDYRMRKKGAHSKPLLKLLKVYYIGITISVGVMILLVSLLMSYGDLLMKTNPRLFGGAMIGSILGYFLLITVFARWFFRAVKKLNVESLPAEIIALPQSPTWEYRSRFELLGLPFIHIRTGGWRGGDPARKRPPVKAWIAADDAFAFGVLFAYGAVAVAPVSIGAVAIGLFSYGGLAIGALAVGGFGFGVWAFGGFAAGWQVSAGCAVAWNIASGGQYAIAHQFALVQWPTRCRRIMSLSETW